MKVIAIAAVIALLTSCVISRQRAAPETPPLITVAHVDLDRYLGLWYEIGRYPNTFQKGCLDSTAMYTARPDGEIDVLNSCRDEQDGSLREARGRAWVVDNAPGNARLKVSFFWPFREIIGSSTWDRSTNTRLLEPPTGNISGYSAVLRQ